MEIFESPCFNTWRFKNFCGLNTEIFQSSCFNTWRLKNLHVLKHGGFVRQNCSYFPISVFQYTEIQKSPCIKHKKNFESLCFNTRRFKNIRVLNHKDSKTSVFYTCRFFLNANNSVKSQQMMKIF